MDVNRYCTVAEAASIANVTEIYVRVLLSRTKGKGPPFRGVKMGRAWLVVREDAERFVRQPGMGRPKKAKRVPKRKPKPKG
jgi:hypothetical protein